MADTLIYDLSISSGEALEIDETLQTAITLSLFTWSRAQTDDAISDPTDRKGWWGDTYAEAPGDQFGSRIWTLLGRSITPALLATLKQMIEEALAWMVEDQLIGGVEVELEQIRHGVIAARIGVLRPPSATVQPVGLWEISLNAV